jgi:hypothetical protein
VPCPRTASRAKGAGDAPFAAQPCAGENSDGAG